ncbi:uncharacterized protein LOC130996956 isoform X2 [Salvia miltiorrhiza]|uniref:uncharacterized protein LOC130996956 isoform X2 n=1 Tax=Salvia miltiorrhiza TaxID=226208 RepID=UPI0025ACEABD|nr:uncharacterized protein LOC130996956 isoform X2 [Salvia miltiorrhiza]
MIRSILSSPCRRNLSPSNLRRISTTPHLSFSWMDKVKGVLGQKTESPSSQSAQSFTLLRFAEEMRKARKLGTLKQFVVGRSSEATFGDAFEKQEAIIRYLGGVDPTGEKIETRHKQDAAKQCNCTLTEVENTLAKFTWAKQAQGKLEQLHAEGKPIPTSMAEIQKLMGSSPLDHARSNMAKSGKTSRNSPCPCGSKKLYKRCCGKDKSS